MHRLSSVDEAIWKSLDKAFATELKHDTRGKDVDELCNSALEINFSFQSCLETL